MIPESAPLFPEYLNIETTNKCNLKCVMCPRDKMTRAEGTMHMELYRKIVEDCASYVEHIKVFMPFMDGEPLLDNLLEERIRIAKDAGIRFIEIATNGTLLTKSRARSLVESGLDSIIISLEDIDKDVHERIRRGCDYNRVVSNLENFISIRDKAGSTTPRITVRMLDVGANSSHREAFLDYWKTKVEHITVVPAHNWGGTVPFGEEVRQPNTECAYLWTTMVILVDGTVALCCLDYDGVHRLGNARHESVYDIWHGQKFKEYRERFRNCQIDLCNRCNWIPGSAIADIRPEREKTKQGVGGHVNRYKKNPDRDIPETGYCIICGQNSTFRFDPTVINAQLKQAWGLSDRLIEAFNRRESMFCSSCGSSLRIRRLCSALIQTFSEITGKACKSLVELLNDKEFCSLRIAEINACGALHSFLVQHPNLHYSEFVPGVEPVNTYEEVRCEDLQSLTYPDDYFDIVLTSDTLEHVPDPEKALNEIYRVLKPGGFHLFTVPVIPSQGATIRRARLVNGERQFLLAPAYHGSWGQEDMFVFTDFGMDIVHKLKLIGFVTDVLFFNTDDELEMAFAFRSKKAKHIPSATRIGEYPILEWTGERFLPWIEGAQINYEHVHRYAFAAHFVKSKKVLDLACGEGYGTYMLAREAEYVAGVEIDKPTVQHAGSRYIKDNLEFIEGSILAVPIEGEKKFDVVVCFEAIEHIAEHDKLLSEVKRLLKDDGLLIVSTPNKAVYTDEPDYHNPFHVKELDFNEFKSLLRQYFTHMRIFGQRVYAGSNMWSIHQQKSRGYIEEVVKKGDMEFYFAERVSKEPVYFIALASNASLKPSTSITDSWLTDASNTLLNDYAGQLAKLNHTLQDKAAQITSLKTSLQEKVGQIHRLESQIHRLEFQIHRLESQIQQIQQSIPMQLVGRYQRVIEKLLRRGTRRRRYYELMLSGVRVILNEGWRSFWRRAKSYSAQRSGGAGLEIRPLKIMSLDSKKPVATSDKRVSIVIPTKNAGTDFVSTLKKIRNQIGIREVELVIVDSGSTDDTVKLAKDYAATVHSVKPSEFNHGLTRNYAADRSSGDYILFMVQDAVPIGNHWLFDMVNVLEIGNGVTAVTCRQVPRDDADLFARYSLWTYYRAMEFSRDEVRMTNSKFDDLPPREKRRLCALEDVCCLIRKDVFEKFKFKNIQYAEDLELGVRLQRAGHKIAFLYSVGVIHSHNRSASYHLPRRYVESKLLPEILAYEPVYRYCDIPSINDLMSCIMTAYATLNMSVSSLRPFGENACAAISRVKALLQNRTRNNSIALNNYGRSGGYLDGLFDELMKIVETTPNPRSNDLIKETYFAALDGLALYVAQNGPVKGKENEFIDALYKIFAMVAGSALADYYLFKSRKGEISQVLSAVDRALSTGV